jgi:hypothetical protein
VLAHYADVDVARYGDGNEENPLANANVIAHPEIELSGKMIDATTCATRMPWWPITTRPPHCGRCRARET